MEIVEDVERTRYHRATYAIELRRKGTRKESDESIAVIEELLLESQGYLIETVLQVVYTDIGPFEDGPCEMKNKEKVRRFCAKVETNWLSSCSNSHLRKLFPTFTNQMMFTADFRFFLFKEIMSSKCRIFGDDPIHSLLLYFEKLDHGLNDCAFDKTWTKLMPYLVKYACEQNDEVVKTNTLFQMLRNDPMKVTQIKETSACLELIFSWIVWIIRIVLTFAQKLYLASLMIACGILLLVFIYILCVICLV